MEHLLNALGDLCTLRMAGIILLSAAYGIFFGAIPGLTATMAVALLVPVAFYLPPLEALAAVVTLEACAIWAGDIPNALVRIPGTPASAAYTDDIYAWGRRGQGDRILGRSLLFSVTGGLFGVLVLVFLAQPLAKVAGWFTSAEYFWFYVLGLGCTVVVSRGSPLRGAFALLIGLFLSTVGLGAGHARPRFTFGIPELFHGIDMIPAMIGLFGVSEVLRSMMSLEGQPPVVAAEGEKRGLIGSVFSGAFVELFRRPIALLRSSSIGAVIGMLPGAGADIAAWVSYGFSRRFSKKPEEYGKGSEEGVVDASTANNASLAGAWVPALVFGIPGDSITAIVIGILMMKNLKPGPEIFEKQGQLVAALYIVFFLANLLLIPIGFLAIKAGGLIIRVPRKILVPVILLFCVIGAFAINQSGFDVGVMLVMGVLGFFLDRRQIPLGPIVLGLVLGGPLEEKFIQTVTKSDGSLAAFVDRPGSALLAAVCLAMWGAPLLKRLLFRAKTVTPAA